MSSVPGTRLGIITGSGPEAGLDLWAKILEENRSAMGTSFRGDIDAPHVTVLSVPGVAVSNGQKRRWSLNFVEFAGFSEAQGHYKSLDTNR